MGPYDLMKLLFILAAVVFAGMAVVYLVCVVKSKVFDLYDPRMHPVAYLATLGMVVSGVITGVAMLSLEMSSSTTPPFQPETTTLFFWVCVLVLVATATPVVMAVSVRRKAAVRS